jgi:hypothetical protein
MNGKALRKKLGSICVTDQAPHKAPIKPAVAAGIKACQRISTLWLNW